VQDVYLRHIHGFRYLVVFQCSYLPNCATVRGAFFQSASNHHSGYYDSHLLSDYIELVDTFEQLPISVLYYDSHLLSDYIELDDTFEQLPISVLYTL
jgi:hypothetical protein